MKFARLAGRIGRLTAVGFAASSLAAPLKTTRPPPPPATIDAPIEEAAPPAESASLLGVGVTGRIFSDLYVPYNNNAVTSTLQQFSGSAWLELDPKIADTSIGHVTLVADQLDMTQTGTLRVGLREAYLAYQSAGWDIRAGKQIIPWGKSDAINPTDFLTGKDYTFFNPDDEVRRVGSTSFFFGFTPSQGNSPLTFQLYWSPAFAASRLLFSNSVLPASVNPSIPINTPAVSLENSEGAFRVLFAGSKWDASVLAYRGWNHLPQLAFSSAVLVPTPVVSLSQAYSRITAAGGDLSFTLDPWIFRLEGSYVWTENNSGNSTLIVPSYLFAVAGIERPLGTYFRAQLQGVLKAYPYWLSPTTVTDPDPVLGPIKAQIAQTNALILNYQDRVRPSATARIAYENTTRGWEAELFGMLNFIGADFLVRPKVAYHLTDAIRLTLGADVYVGDADTPLGALKPYNAVFTEAKLSF